MHCECQHRLVACYQHHLVDEVEEFRPREAWCPAGQLLHVHIRVQPNLKE